MMPHSQLGRSVPFESEAEALGARVREARLRLGLTQQDLAADLGRTQGWLSKIERGRVELDRTSVINELASALRVHPNDLIDRPYATEDSARWQRSAAAIMRELRRYDLVPRFEGQPRSSGALWQETAKLHRLRDAAANAAILEELPDLLRESRALAEISTGHEKEHAYAVYAVCCKFAHTAAHALGQPELVAMACERASWAARFSGDELMPSVADWMRVWDMWATADWEDAEALSDQALGSVDPLYRRGDPAAVRVWGSLHLRAAVSAARAGREAEARHRIAQAREAADRLPEAGLVFDRHSLTFSPGNVHTHGVHIELEMTQHDQALKLHETGDSRELDALPASRQGYYRMDLSRAYLWSGKRDRAFQELELAEQTAPQLIRNHPIARATLRRIVSAERASLRNKLRRMSARFHLDG